MKSNTINIMNMTKFYNFDQNNTGGSFVVDNDLCHRLYIEAESADEATAIAEAMGVYFDGCDDGTDCECCGDRWYRLWTNDGITLPYKFGNETFDTIEDYVQHIVDGWGWTMPDARIFYKDGTRKEFYKNGK
jgi:hypothetical protein